MQRRLVLFAMCRPLGNQCHSGWRSMNTARSKWSASNCSNEEASIGSSVIGEMVLQRKNREFSEMLSRNALFLQTNSGGLRKPRIVPADTCVLFIQSLHWRELGLLTQIWAWRWESASPAKHADHCVIARVWPVHFHFHRKAENTNFMTPNLALTFSERNLNQTLILINIFQQSKSHATPQKTTNSNHP